jgi:hypothetical protein
MLSEFQRVVVGLKHCVSLNSDGETILKRLPELVTVGYHHRVNILGNRWCNGGGGGSVA